ncbi:MAG: ATP-binding cassette domain-containing protein [Spirochaetota bacterium]
MLRVDSLAHRYGSARVLSGVFLHCAPGEIVGVLGRNGCGKTTMLRAIFGSLAADQIHVTIDNRSVGGALRAASISYLSQEPYLPRTLTVRRALELSIPGFDTETAAQSFPLLAPLLDSGQTARRVRDLSGGEQRAVELFVALSLPVRYTLLDEPFTEVEPAGRVPIAEVVTRTARETGRGIVVTDHAYRDVLAIADRLYVMAQGELYEVASEAELARYGYTRGE